MTCIVYIINEQYVHPFHVSLTSLITNNPNLDCDIIVMYDGELSEKSIQIINNIYPKIILTKVKNELISYDKLLKYRTDQWINKNYSVFSRFEIFNLENYNKIIYIDTDTIIDNNIDFLINDCNDNECYAVRRENGKGFNAGVMVINKKQNFNIYKNRCLNILKQLEEARGNQSIFNECFKSSTTYIDCKYNLTTMYPETSHHLQNNTAVILHYPGAKKPWDRTKFSDYYGSSTDYIKSEFIKKWYSYEKICEDNYKIL